MIRTRAGIRGLLKHVVIQGRNFAIPSIKKLAATYLCLGTSGPLDIDECSLGPDLKKQRVQNDVVSMSRLYCLRHRIGNSQQARSEADNSNQLKAIRLITPAASLDWNRHSDFAVKLKLLMSPVGVASLSLPQPEPTT